MKTPTVEKIATTLVDMAKALSKALEDNKIKLREWPSIVWPLVAVPSILEDRKLLPEEIKLLSTDQNARFAVVEEVANRFGVPENKAEMIIKLTLDFYFDLDNYIDDIKDVLAGGEPPFSRKVKGDLGAYFANLENYL